MTGRASDEHWMQRALALAQAAADRGEIPVGAVLVLDDEMLGEGSNNPIGASDPTAHAEILALRQAAERLGNYRLVNTTLYVTIEPCTMCVGAIVHARVGRVVFGAPEPKAGAVVSQNQLFDHPAMNYRVRYEGGVLEDACRGLISAFFSRKRALQRAQKSASSD